MRPNLVIWILLLMLSNQLILAQHPISFDIEKRLQAGKSANVAVLSNYDPSNKLAAGSLIEYEISLQEEEESSRFCHIQIKRVLFREYGKEKMYGFDSFFPQIDNDLFAPQEALVGTSFMFELENKDLPEHGFVQDLYEQAMGQIDANTEQSNNMLGVYHDYFSEELFRQHLSPILGVPFEGQFQTQVSFSMLPERTQPQKTVITGHIDGREMTMGELTSIGMYIHGIDPQKKEYALEKDNTFRFTFELSEPSRVHVFCKNIGGALVLFLMPGDHLHINLTSQTILNERWNVRLNKIYQHVEFIGDRAAENTFLHEYIQKYRGNQWWTAPVTLHGGLKDQESPEEITRYLQAEHQVSLAYLKESNDSFTPEFNTFFETEINYFYTHAKRGWGVYEGPLFDSLTLCFPILEDLFQQNFSYNQTEKSLWYKRYLDSYFYRRLKSTSALGEGDDVSAESKYHFISIIFEGYPMYLFQADMLVESYQKHNIDFHVLRELAEDFLENCKDVRLTEPVRQAMERAENLSYGNPIPPFYLRDQDGEKHEINRWTGKPILLVFSNTFLREEMSHFQHLYDEFPELELLLVEGGYHMSSSGFYPAGTKKEKNRTSIYIPFEAENSSLPGTKFPPQPIGREDLAALGIYGDSRYYAFLIDKDGILQSEWGEDILSRPENLYENIKWIIYGDAHDNPWLSAEVLLPVGSGLVFLPILFILLMRLYRRRTQKREEARRLILERELKGIRAQLNPHFLFNAMGSIQNLVDSSKPEEANHYLSQFSSLMRQVLSHSQQEMIPLVDEINLLNNYLELETLRHGFQWEITVDPNIDIHNTEVPSMMLQPYVENAILHGIAGMGSAGKIFIKIDKLSRQILVTIEDNGLGIENTLALQGEHITKGNGLGMKLTQERMQKLGDRYGGDFRILLHDKTYDEIPAHGTRVEVWIPTEG